MDLLGLVMVFLGTVALCMGVYELARHTVVGRNVSASTQDQIQAFSRVDGCCYLAEGLIVVLLAFSDYIPVLNSEASRDVLLFLFLGIVVFNVIMARRMLNSFPKK